jgi:hypothetical protein
MLVGVRFQGTDIVVEPSDRFPNEQEPFRPIISAEEVEDADLRDVIYRAERRAAHATGPFRHFPLSQP